MKIKYDFSKGIKGKFHVSATEIKLPVYLDKKNSSFFMKLASKNRVRLSKIVNDVLTKDREIIGSVMSQGK